MDCCPMAISRPPTLMLLLPSAVIIWGTVTPKACRRIRSAVTSNCLVVPPQALICTTPGTVSRRRVTTQSWMVRRLVRPKFEGPTTW